MKFTIEAKAKGTKEKYRRVYRHERTGRFIWSGTEYANMAKGTKKVHGSIHENEKTAFEKWCARKNLAFRYSEIVEYPNATHYSKNFTKKELNCHCGCTPSHEVADNLARLAGLVLEPMRKTLGQIPILSGHRCKAYNDNVVHGAKNSQHVLGTAFDPDLSRMNIGRAAFLKELKKHSAVNGVGVYPNGGAHGDIRKPPRVEWTSF